MVKAQTSVWCSSELLSPPTVRRQSATTMWKSRRLLTRGACAVLGGGLAVCASGAGEGVVCASAVAKHLDPWIERWKVKSQLGFVGIGRD